MSDDDNRPVHACVPCLAGESHLVKYSRDWPLCEQRVDDQPKITGQRQLLTCPVCVHQVERMIAAGQLDVDAATGFMSITPGD